MKKLLTLILTISIVASLTACGDKAVNNDAEKKEESETVNVQTEDTVKEEENSE